MPILNILSNRLKKRLKKKVDDRIGTIKGRFDLSSRLKKKKDKLKKRGVIKV